MIVVLIVLRAMVEAADGDRLGRGRMRWVWVRVLCLSLWSRADFCEWEGWWMELCRALRVVRDVQ